MLKPLNIEQAKSFFISMGCSHFHMSREDSDYYRRYQLSDIDKETEILWRSEVVSDYFRSFPFNNPESIAHAFGRLCDTIDFNRKNLEMLSRLLVVIKNQIPLNALHIVLGEIVGRTGSPTHGGLMERSIKISANDLLTEFKDHAKELIEVAEDNGKEVLWIRGYLADILEVMGFENRKYIKQLRLKDDVASFKYYQHGASNNNIFSMVKLADHYRYGKGCVKDTDKAVFWLEKAAKSGNTAAIKLLSELK